MQLLILIVLPLASVALAAWSVYTKRSDPRRHGFPPDMIEQRLKQREASSSSGYQKKSDVLEMLLDLMEGDEYDLSIEEIKHLLFVSLY